MSARLPTPGGDDGQWGDILNEFLDVSHAPDGTIKDIAISSAGAEVMTNKGQALGYAPLDAASKIPTVNLGGTGASTNTFLRGDQSWATMPSVVTGVPGPGDQGLMGWTSDPTTIASAGSVLTSQRIQYARIIVPKSGTITGVAVQVIALPTSASNTFFGLYDGTGSRVAVTNDVSSLITATGAKEFAFAASYTAAAGIYYVGFIQTATTPMSLGRAGLGSSQVYNFGIAAAPFRYNTGATGQTTLPASVTFSLMNASNDAYWLALY